MIEPTPKQGLIRDHQDLSLLILAPAGCGKTEALGMRAQGLLDRDQIVSPQRILVTTFSNRARDNVRSRMRSYLTAQQMSDRVTISNFHGLAARIFRAHADVIGLDPYMELPDSDWVADICREQGLKYEVSQEVQGQLRLVKQQGPLADSAIADQLSRYGASLALDIEERRKREARLTYDDLPRMAELILDNDSVAELYRNHFAATIVDEFQDLTPQQMRIINRIGFGKTTYAGDLAQGIYSFAGARPVEALSSIQAECAEKIELDESHRSSPAVLSMVNSLSDLTGGLPLRSARPMSWPNGGLAGGAAFDSVHAEAQWVLEFCTRVLQSAAEHRIGVISRTKPRRRFVEEGFDKAGVPFYRWEDGVLDTDTARLLRTMLTRLSATEFKSADDKLGFLRTAIGLDSALDSNDRTALADAIRWTFDRLQEGATPSEIRDRIRVGDKRMVLDLPGVHMLTGHSGKGQQFDWVVLVGFEEGAIPDFRQTSTPDDLAEESRVLAVIISRARYGVVVTASSSVPTKAGRPIPREVSQFASYLRRAAPLDIIGINNWMNRVDWSAIRTPSESG